MIVTLGCDVEIASSTICVETDICFYTYLVYSVLDFKAHTDCESIWNGSMKIKSEKKNWISWYVSYIVYYAIVYDV